MGFFDWIDQSINDYLVQKRMTVKYLNNMPLVYIQEHIHVPQCMTLKAENLEFLGIVFYKIKDL